MLPESIEKRTQLNNLIERGVQLLREQDQLKDDLDQVKQEVEEEIGKDFAKEFLAKVKARHQAGKTRADADKKLEILAELEILENANSKEEA